MLKRGDVPESKEGEEPDPSLSKTYHIAEPRDFERGVVDRFLADDANKPVMEEMLARNSSLGSEKVLQIVERFFEASRRQDSETLRILLESFSGGMAEKVREEIRERGLPKVSEMQLGQLVEMLRNKKVLFYTGAGISMASGVHGMDQLQKMLGMDLSKNVDDLLKKAVVNPERVIELWEEFTKAAFEKPATLAHESLAFLSQKLVFPIFTENVDHLQEQAGVKATHITGPWLKEHVQPKWLNDIDAVITVGLSYDDRGFLGWYKEHNPKGKIVAIDLNQPSYLGNEDFLLKADCQDILPKLEKMVVAKG